MGFRDTSNIIVVLDHQKKHTRKSYRYIKEASTLGNEFVADNKAASQVKIRSFTRGFNYTGKDL